MSPAPRPLRLALAAVAGLAALPLAGRLGLWLLAGPLARLDLGVIGSLPTRLVLAPILQLMASPPAPALACALGGLAATAALAARGRGGWGHTLACAGAAGLLAALMLGGAIPFVQAAAPVAVARAVLGAARPE